MQMPYDTSDLCAPALPAAMLHWNVTWQNIMNSQASLPTTWLVLCFGIAFSFSTDVSIPKCIWNLVGSCCSMSSITRINNTLAVAWKTNSYCGLCVDAIMHMASWPDNLYHRYHFCEFTWTYLKMAWGTCSWLPSSCVSPTAAPGTLHEVKPLSCWCKNWELVFKMFFLWLITCYKY